MAIVKEGSCIDTRHDTVWIRLVYDGSKEKTTVEVWEKQHGHRVVVNGATGPLAKQFYDRLNIYFFGYE